MILRKMLVAVLGVGFVVGCSTGQPVQSNPGNSMPSDMKLMSYNVMHCAGVDNKLNIARTAEVIKR